ncbi:hypothetical protein EII35_12880 [Arachnia propionica]|uniref:Uncharacterized protein n=1 Tax=Arachnia propionica TaxID=1750 RepID=A0A3P1WRH2_9ACTN|nr:hypothetical protein EII35_12880 [Arachnia propionica]
MAPIPPAALRFAQRATPSSFRPRPGVLPAGPPLPRQRRGRAGRPRRDRSRPVRRRRVLRGRPGAVAPGNG